MWSIALTCISPRVNRLYYSIIILFRSLSSGDVLSNAGSLKAWAVKAVVATLDRYSYFFLKIHPWSPGCLSYDGMPFSVLLSSDILSFNSHGKTLWAGLECFQSFVQFVVVFSHFVMDLQMHQYATSIPNGLFK